MGMDCHLVQPRLQPFPAADDFRIRQVLEANKKGPLPTDWKISKPDPKAYEEARTVSV